VAERIDPQEALRAIVSVTGELSDEPAEEVVSALTPLLDFARRLIAAHPTDIGLLPMLSGLARRLGAVDEAIAWCERAEAVEPSMISAVMLGYAYRKAGRPDETLAAWRRGLDRDPGNVALHVDIAEEVDRQGRIVEALDWLDRALAVDPADEKAFPSACEMRFRASGDVAHLVALTDHWRDHPDHTYSGNRLSMACDGRAWLDHPPRPTEAVSNAVRQLYDREGDDDPAEMTGELTVSALEAPSAVAAFAAALPGIGITVQDVPAPDLRERFAPGQVELWRYEATTAHPVPPPPSAVAVEALHALVTGGWWHPRQAYEQAIGLSAVPAADLLGLLVHPVPPAPSWQDFHRRDPTLWLRVTQVWACLGLLHHGGDTPWAGSTRRATLRDIAFGIEDWTTDAALFAMVVAAWLDPSARADVADAVTARFDALREADRRRDVTIMESVADLVLITPGMPAAVRDTARAVLDAE
jgi:tetratricopeptide (TPR) repeat protein